MSRKLLFVSLILLALTAASFVYAQDLAAMIRELQAKIQELQRQLDELEASGKTKVFEFAQNLRRGASGNDVKRLQEFLKETPEIYPAGLVTGRFGPLTEAAVKRFQAKNGILETGVVGPLTRSKLNELLSAKAVPPPSPLPLPLPEPTPTPAATTTPPTPALTQTATTTPPAPLPATTTPPVIPTQIQLGLPINDFFGWGKDYMKVEFHHEPGSFTRAYRFYVRTPGETTFAKFGPYATAGMAIGESKTFSEDVTLKRVGEISWEWKKKVDYNAQAEGDSEAYLTAVGDGDVESTPSPGRLATLYPKAEFDDLVQGASPQSAVENFIVKRLPLAVRLKNSYEGLRYKYFLYDGETTIWDTGNITQSTLKIEAQFNNVNSYTLDKNKSYILRVHSYDNTKTLDSVRKQKTNEQTLKFDIL